MKKLTTPDHASTCSTSKPAIKEGWALVLPLILIPSGLVFIAVLNDYYVFGDVLDIGWFSSVAWHNGFDLKGPPSYPFSFFNLHIAPILWLTNLVSYLLPLSKIDYWALLCAIPYVLFATGVCRLWLMTEPSEKWRPFEKWLAVFVALSATFSAIGVQALRQPHLEMGIPALALWFFLYLCQHQFRAASIFFVLCLMIREDAGLHLFGLLLLMLLVLRVTHKPELQKVVWRYAVVALFYSVIALIVKYQFFMKWDNMALVYTGNPAWRHLAWELIRDRIDFFLSNRTFIWLPSLMAVVWAFYARNPLIPLGYIAAVPWLVWNLMAVRLNPARLDFYYAFPFWLALAWPLLSLKLWPRKEKSSLPERWPYFFLLLASLVGWQEERLTVYPFSAHAFEIGQNAYEGNPFVVGPEWGRARAMQRFIDYFAAHQSSFSRTAMDMPVLGVVIDSNTTVPWLGNWNSLHPDVLPDIIVYFDGGYEWAYWVRPTLKAYPNRFLYFYKLPDTKIRIAAAHPIQNLLAQPMPFAPVENK